MNNVILPPQHMNNVICNVTLYSCASRDIYHQILCFCVYVSVHVQSANGTTPHGHHKTLAYQQIWFETENYTLAKNMLTSNQFLQQG